MTRALAMAAAVAVLLSACGGSQALPPADSSTTCPADPTTFTGPLPTQCLPQAQACPHADKCLPPPPTRDTAQ